MALEGWFVLSRAQPGAPGLSALTVSREQWREAAQNLATAGAWLVTPCASRDGHAAPKIHGGFSAVSS